MEEEVKRTKISIIILGESAVGKTCVCLTFLGSEFHGDVIATVGVEKMDSTIKIETGEELKLKIWDTAGQERFKAASLKYLRYSQAAIIVFDLTNKNSFDQVPFCLKDIRDLAPNIPVVLFGNKSDLVNERKVDKSDIDSLCKREGLEYFETSAKNNTGIKEGFTKIATLAYKIFPTIPNRGLKLSNKINEKEKKC